MKLSTVGVKGARESWGRGCGKGIYNLISSYVSLKFSNVVNSKVYIENILLKRNIFFLTVLDNKAKGNCRHKKMVCSKIIGVGTRFYGQFFKSSTGHDVWLYIKNCSLSS